MTLQGWLQFGVVAGLFVVLTPLLGAYMARVYGGGRAPGERVLEMTWGATAPYDTNLLRVHVAHIRRKLEPDPSRPRYFHTEAGMGYRFISGDPDGPG